MSGVTEPGSRDRWAALLRRPRAASAWPPESSGGPTRQVFGPCGWTAAIGTGPPASPVRMRLSENWGSFSAACGS